MANDKSDGNTDLHVMIFAGPNGSGKTSLIDEIRATGLATVKRVYPVPTAFINPDQVAKDLKGDFPTQDARDEAAQRAAMRIRSEAMASKEPFAFETVMSHPSRINEMMQLKNQGYQLLFTFITTDDPETNVARVKFRYETGSTTGHYVPPEKVRERYHRTLALLPKAVEIADAVYIYDNSADFHKPRLQAVIEGDAKFSVAGDAKEWVYARLIHPLQQRERELEQLIVALENAGHQVDETNELAGEYTGPVLFRKQYFVAQLDQATSHAVVHDRLILDTFKELSSGAEPGYKQNEILTVRYSPSSAPVVRQKGATLPVKNSDDGTKNGNSKSRGR